MNLSSKEKRMLEGLDQQKVAIALISKGWQRNKVLEALPAYAGKKVLFFNKSLTQGNEPSIELMIVSHNDPQRLKRMEQAVEDFAVAEDLSFFEALNYFSLGYGYHQVPVDLVVAQWRKQDGQPLDSDLEIELTLGSWHSGTVFSATLHCTTDDYAYLRQAQQINAEVLVSLTLGEAPT